MVADASALESEITELKTKLHNEEKARKVEVAALKLRYENHVTAISAELKDVQAQVMRFKHERNKYKQLLETVQKTASENKTPLNQSLPMTTSEEVGQHFDFGDLSDLCFYNFKRQVHTCFYVAG